MKEKKRTFTEWLFTFLTEHDNIEVRMEQFTLYDESGIAIVMIDHDEHNDVRVARKVSEVVYPQNNSTKMTMDDFMIFSMTRLYERLKFNE